MKRLIVFLATLLAVCGIAGAQVPPLYCDHINGLWQSGTNPPYEVNCDTNTHCTFTIAGNPTCVNDWNGTWGNDSNGYLVLSYTGTYKSGTCGTQTFPYTGSIYVSGPGCMYLTQSVTGHGSETFIHVSSFSTTALQYQCDMPGTNGTNGENASVSKGWGTGSNQYGNNYTATLVKTAEPTGFDFQGRAILENVTMSSDHCLGTMTTSDIAQSNNPTWYPDSTNDYSVGSTVFLGADVYAPDSIGLEIPLGVEYAIQAQQTYSLTLPCTITTKQVMSIDCLDFTHGTPPTYVYYVPYEVHYNTFTLDDGTLTVSRNNTDSTNTNIGEPRKVWRWIDFAAFFFPGEFY